MLYYLEMSLMRGWKDVAHQRREINPLRQIAAKSSTVMISNALIEGRVHFSRIASPAECKLHACDPDLWRDSTAEVCAELLHISSEAEHGKNWLHETFISIGRRLISSGALGFIFSLSPSSSHQGKAKRCFTLPVPLSDSVSLLRWNSALSALNVRGRVSFAFPLRSLRHTPGQPSAFLLEEARPFLTLGPLYARRGDKRAEQVVVEENGLGK
jgi:hypothetical protein